jgi:tetratricopeptide (TPR) repeat protein
MWIAMLGAAGVGFAVGGCVPPEGSATGGAGATAIKPTAPLKPKEAEQVVNDASAAFDRKQFDQAMAGADRILAANPQGPGAAEAQYLRGRVFEVRALEAGNAGEYAAAKAALQSARDAYNAALSLAPAPVLEGSIRAQIANVAYHQDDYATAIAQGTAAYQKIAEPNAKAWVLYRVGLSQQRFGSFPEADRTFAAVQQEFPNTEQARRAAAHQGARGFHVQVGTFSAPTNADGAVSELRSQGVIGLSLPNANGQHVVRVGPVQTYEQAKALKARVAGRYPDAVIIP